MALTDAYTMVHLKLEEFFSKIRDGQAPPQFSQQYLKDIGFTSTNHRSYIKILKALEFLTPDGKPTKRYTDYRDHSASKTIMGEAIKEAYSDIFLIKENPTESDRATIEGKFKSYHNSSDLSAKRMANTFYALLAIADINSKPQKKKKEQPQKTEPKTEPEHSVPHPIIQSAPGLHYNIQIHLPATKDVEVYNAIFKSLKEHLY